jgi:hypothetical protein
MLLERFKLGLKGEKFGLRLFLGFIPAGVECFAFRRFGILLLFNPARAAAMSFSVHSVATPSFASWRFFSIS